MMVLDKNSLLKTKKQFEEAGVAGEPEIMPKYQQVIEPPIATEHKPGQPIPDMRYLKIKNVEIK